MPCEDCKYWEVHCDEKLRQYRTQKGRGCEGKKCVKEIECDEGSTGFCHRYPPNEKADADADVDGVFIPISVYGDNYCGEFQPKEIKPGEQE